MKTKKLPFSNLIGDRAFYSMILTLLIPMIIQNTITNVVNLLDNLMVGRIGTLQMSAVAIINQLFFIFFLCTFGIMSGIGIFVSQFSGAGDTHGIRQCFRLKLIAGLIIALITGSVLFLFSEEIISLFFMSDISPEDLSATMTYAKDYLFIMLASLLPVAISASYLFTLREIGETKPPMIASVIAILVNLVFNYFLIFGTFGFPRLGVAGAAIATVLSRIVELGYIVGHVHRNSGKYAFITGAFRNFNLEKKLIGKVTKRAVPLMLNEFLWSVQVTILMQCYSTRGLEVVAASNITSTIFNLFSLIFLSIGSAAGIIVGKSQGAGNLAEAKDQARKILALNVVCATILGICMYTTAPVIPSFYNTEPVVKALATTFVKTLSLLMPFLAFSHAAFFTLRSGGNVVITMLLDVGHAWGMAVPAACILGYFTSVSIVPMYAIVQGLDILKAILAFILFKTDRWLKKLTV